MKPSSRGQIAAMQRSVVEVPVLIGLAYVALWARRRFYPEEVAA